MFSRPFVSFYIFGWFLLFLSVSAVSSRVESRLNLEFQRCFVWAAWGTDCRGRALSNPAGVAWVDKLWADLWGPCRLRCVLVLVLWAGDVVLGYERRVEVFHRWSFIIDVCILRIIYANYTSSLPVFLALNCFGFLNPVHQTATLLFNDGLRLWRWLFLLGGLL